MGDYPEFGPNLIMWDRQIFLLVKIGISPRLPFHRGIHLRNYKMLLNELKNLLSILDVIMLSWKLQLNRGLLNKRKINELDSDFTKPTNYITFSYCRYNIIIFPSHYIPLMIGFELAVTYRQKLYNCQEIQRLAVL